MIENINIDGSNVTAELHALMYDYVHGYSGVYNYGQKLAYQLVSNNEIRIKDGLLINQGRFMRIVTGSYEAISIENGTSGINRIDLIVARFETDGITERHSIVVKKGTGNIEPTLTQGNTFAGAKVNEMPLYAVHLTGLSITNVVQKFVLIPSFKDHTHTKAQIGLGNVENKSGATIRNEMTQAEVLKALTYTPLGKYNAIDGDANTLSASGVYTISGDNQTNTPMLFSWLIRVEVLYETYITQWATKSTGKATYKRSCVNGTWSEWTLVEGEELIYSGSLENQKSITFDFDIAQRYKKLFIFVSQVGYIEVTQRDGNQWSGMTVIFNPTYTIGYLGICNVYLDGNTLTNKICGYKQFNELTNLSSETSNITVIIGRP